MNRIYRLLAIKPAGTKIIKVPYSNPGRLFGCERDWSRIRLLKGVELTVPPEVRETVRAMAKLLELLHFATPDQTISTAKLKGLNTKLSLYLLLLFLVQRGFIMEIWMPTKATMKALNGSEAK